MVYFSQSCTSVMVLNEVAIFPRRLTRTLRRLRSKYLNMRNNETILMYIKQKATALILLRKRKQKSRQFGYKTSHIIRNSGNRSNHFC